MEIGLIKNIIPDNESRKLDEIHNINNIQNKLKKTLLKFDLGPDATIDREFNFNIWCTPQTDGAGDFSLINKIAKEILSYGVPNRQLNFMIGVRNFSTFLRELGRFMDANRDLNVLIQQIQTQLNDNVIPGLANITRNLDILRLSSGNFVNPDSKIKHITYKIPAVEPALPFDKNRNYQMLELLQNMIQRIEGINFRRKREEVRSNLEGELYGTFVNFIYGRILKEFTGAKIYICDSDRLNLIGEPIAGDEVNDIYSQIIARCRIDGQPEKSLNIQLLPSNPTLNGINIFRNCNKNKILYLNEGGNIIIDDREHCMGIGNKSVGIFKASTLVTREAILAYLNTRGPEGFIAEGEGEITKYHIAYIGQTLTYEIDKNMVGKRIDELGFDVSIHRYGLFNVQRVFLFLKLLKHKYRAVEGEIIHIFVLDVFRKILEIFNSRLSVVFPEYNSVDNTFRVNASTVLKLKFFKRIDPAQFIPFIKHSEPILFTTGDQSYQEALSLGKLVFHDYVDHRMAMVDTLLECYDQVFGGTNNYRIFLSTYLKPISGAESILEYTFENSITLFFANAPMITALNNTLLDYFDAANVNNNRFFDFYMKHYDFPKEFKKIIYLMQNNVFSEALRNVLISENFEREFLRINDAGYRLKYLKYKQKYLTLKGKLKGGAIEFEDQANGMKKIRGIIEEGSKHSPIFTNKQKVLTESLFKYLNEKIKFKLNIDYLGGRKNVLGDYLIKNLSSGRVLGRGANGIAIEFDNNIVIKVSKMMATNPSIIENEVRNMIQIYRSGADYNFRNEDLVKLLGVVYLDADYTLIKNFDNSRTHKTEEFEQDLGAGINGNDRIGFVIMEKYTGDLESLNMAILSPSQKYDIVVQMMIQLNNFFTKGYYHTDLHDGNWFYKMNGAKYTIRIADYGSETKADGNRVGVFRLEGADIDEKKKNSLKTALVAMANKGLISQDNLFTLIALPTYNSILSRAKPILNGLKPRVASESDELNYALLESLN